jgi:GntR family transcriptional regulator
MRTPKLERKNIPLYVQLEQILKSKIITGEILPGDQIPTEKELSETYKVSSITARQAVLNLVQEGLLTRKQGKGTYVQGGTTNVKNIMTLSVKGDINDVVPEDLSSQKVNVLDISRVSCPKRVKSTLNLNEGEEVFRIRRTRSDDGVILSYVKNYLPLEIGEKIEREDLKTFPMLHVLRSKLGLPLKTGVQYITAVIADFEIASALSVSISSPVLYLETIISIEGDKPIEFVQTFYRSDQFKYTLKFDLEGIKGLL